MILDLILDLLPPPEENNKMKTSKDSITITTHNHSKPERDKPNKMKSTSERITNINTQRIIAFVTFIICLLIMYWGDEEPNNATVILSMGVFFYLGYLSRRPHPDEKPLIIWLKICILNVQIWTKQAYLYFYPDLKKYRGNPKRKEKVWAKRKELKRLKRELKELV